MGKKHELGTGIDSVKYGGIRGECRITEDQFVPVIYYQKSCFFFLFTCFPELVDVLDISRFVHAVSVWTSAIIQC